MRLLLEAVAAVNIASAVVTFVECGGKHAEGNREWAGDLFLLGLCYISVAAFIFIMAIHP